MLTSNLELRFIIRSLSCEGTLNLISTNSVLRPDGPPCITSCQLRLLRLRHELLHLVLHRRDGIFVGAKPRHGLALFVDDELGEVPLDVAGRKKTGLAKLFFRYLQGDQSGCSIGVVGT